MLVETLLLVTTPAMVALSRYVFEPETCLFAPEHVRVVVTRAHEPTATPATASSSSWNPVAVSLLEEVATLNETLSHEIVPAASELIVNFAIVTTPFVRTVVGSATVVMVGFVLKT